MSRAVDRFARRTIGLTRTEFKRKPDAKGLTRTGFKPQEPPQDGMKKKERRAKRRCAERQQARRLEATQARVARATKPRKPLKTSRKSPTDFSPEARALMAERSEGICEWPICGRAATEMSHRMRRMKTNGYAANGLHLCHEHHRWCHDNPKDAREVYGAVLKTTDDPKTFPVLTRHSPRKILLNNVPDCDGRLWREVSQGTEAA